MLHCVLLAYSAVFMSPLRETRDCYFRKPLRFSIGIQFFNQRFIFHTTRYANCTLIGERKAYETQLL